MITIDDVNKIIKKYVKQYLPDDIQEKAIKHEYLLKFHAEGYHYEKENHSEFSSWVAIKDFSQYWFNYLIGERRPNEREDILDYRKKIYQSKTTTPMFKVITSLKKIVKSPDWEIDYSESYTSNRIKKEENLQTYCEKNLPYYNSIENYMYSLGLQKMLIDPNGYFIVLPKNYNIENNQYLEPYINFIPSHRLRHNDDYSITYLSTRKHTFYENNHEYSDFIVVTIDDTYVYESYKINAKGDVSTQVVFTHQLGYIPRIKAGGYLKYEEDGQTLYTSFLSPMLPSLNEASRLVSDKQAEYVQNIFSTLWTYETQKCNTCDGYGKVKKAGEQVVCGTCNGEGTYHKTPYGQLIVTAPEIGEQAVPTPPAGYIEKSPEMANVLDNAVKSEIYDALSSINMEFLAETPLNQSGTAKEVDRDELNNFVYSIAYHMIENIMIPAYKIIADLRYYVIEPNKELRHKMMPRIAIPERFDILSENYLTNQIKDAIQGKLNPLIVKELEKSYISKKYDNNVKLKNKLIAINELDPFAGRDKDNLLDEAVSGYIKKEDAILSYYIQQFVNEAVNENPKFLELEYLQQLEVVKKKAKEKAETVVIPITDESGNQEAN